MMHQTDELEELHVRQAGGLVRVEEQLLPETVPPAVDHRPAHNPPHALLPRARLRPDHSLHRLLVLGIVANVVHRLLSDTTQFT